MNRENKRKKYEKGYYSEQINFVNLWLVLPSHRIYLSNSIYKSPVFMRITGLLYYKKLLNFN